MLLEFEREVAQIFASGELGAAHLYKLGRYPRDIARGAQGEHRLLAYVLKAVLFDLAKNFEGQPLAAGARNLAVLASSLRAAIAALKGPISANQVVRLADRLLDAREVVLQHVDD